MSTNQITAIATGLSAPRSFTWGPDGHLYIAQSGPGTTTDAAGPKSSVVRIVDGCPVPVAHGLPSTHDPFDEALGPMDVQFIGDRLFILQTATGAPADFTDHPNGIYTANPDGTVALWLDLTTYINSNPPAHMPEDINELGEPYRFLHDGDGFWLIDSSRGLVLFITMEKEIRRIADLSEGHPVLTAMTLDHRGGIYVANLTPGPHADGTSWVKHIDRLGNVETIWTNLTVVTGLALDADKHLYALEMATGNDTPAGMRPGTGRLVRQTGFDTSIVIVDGLEFPIALKTGLDAAFYISMPAYGPNTQAGMILRVPPELTNQTIDLAQFEGATCPNATPYKPPTTTA